MLLDLSERPAAARQLAIQTWDLWSSLAAEYPRAESLSAVIARYRPAPNHGYDHERATIEFESQPLIRAFRDGHPVGGRDRSTYSNEFVFYPSLLMEFVGDWEQFADSVVEQGLGAGGVLTLDGWWIDPEGEAYHGMCASSSCAHAPHPQADAVRQAGNPQAKHRLLVDLPGDVLIVQLHGHF